MEPFKNALGPPAIARISRNFRRGWAAFPERRFRARAERGLEPLELKARVRHIVGALDDSLPDDYERALAIVLRAGELWDRSAAGDSTGGFAAWPVIEWVGERGLSHFDRSFDALGRLTHLFSAEFAIRAFIEHDTKRALAKLARWTRHPSEHVRRLVSEGTRPRLPWGRRLPEFVKDPSQVVALLEKLKDDPSEYVRRSVSNNLNDIAKDHPERVIELCGRWSKAASEERRWLIGRALRTLVKKGDARALAVLGFDHRAKVGVSAFSLSARSVPIGAKLELSFRLSSRESVSMRLVVDYAVHHVKKNGERVPKVFKLKTLELGPRQVVTLTKRHSFEPITTRRYHPGEHAIDVLVNGQKLGTASFELTEPARRLPAPRAALAPRGKR